MNKIITKIYENFMLWQYLNKATIPKYHENWPMKLLKNVLHRIVSE